MAYVFDKNHICFVLCALKKQTHCTYIVCVMPYYFKAQRERTTLQLVYHDCKNLTHTSKTRQVKRTQIIVTVSFTIRVFSTFSAW